MDAVSTQNIGIVQPILLSNYYQIAACSLVLYEHVLTFAEEVRLIRSSKLTSATVLFLLNRYAILAWSVAGILDVLPWDAPARSDFRISYNL
ncbi:hypothetical protein AcV7_005677 [Taiwanofungus camphoratus]|nr:hypothetical protein AcV7_005677 [Antrodia cinnamomea]